MGDSADGAILVIGATQKASRSVSREGLTRGLPDLLSGIELRYEERGG